MTQKWLKSRCMWDVEVKELKEGKDFFPKKDEGNELLHTWL